MTIRDTEEQLIELSVQIGYIAEMNAPATFGFAGYLHQRLDTRAVGALTLAELLVHHRHWKARNARAAANPSPPPARVAQAMGKACCWVCHVPFPHAQLTSAPVQHGASKGHRVLICAGCHPANLKSEI